MAVRSAGQVSAGADPAFELVHAEALRGFPELVAELGGDLDALLAEAGVAREALDPRSGDLGLRAVSELLELAAVRLRTPDLGLRLARRQGGPRAFGPMGVVMRNCNTLGEALHYVIEHAHAYSLAARMTLERDPGRRRVVMGMELLLDRLPHHEQAIEQVLLLAHLNAQECTGGRARVREVHFRHQPLSPLRTYRDYFGCEVRFDERRDAVIYADQDLACAILDPDTRLYEMATAFIEARFTRVTPPMRARVRGLILRHLGGEDCTNERVAAELGLHPRTLHRRLKEEGASFEAIKDEVRRDVALRCLQQGDLPLTRIAEKLGYAETSVLSRSCLRWFAASPRKLRSEARQAAAAAARA